MFCYSQVNWPNPDSTLRNDCVASKTPIKVIYGELTAISDNDTSSLFPVYYNELDGNRLMCNLELLKLLIDNGMLNFEIVRKSDFPPTTASQLYDNQKLSFFTIDGKKDSIPDSVIFISASFVSNKTTKNTRVFEFNTSLHETDALTTYFLEVTNNSANETTSISDFMKNAYISCVLKWFWEY